MTTILSPHQAAVYALICAAHCSGDPAPTIAEISVHAEISYRAAYDTTRKLIDAGLIIRIKPGEMIESTYIPAVLDAEYTVQYHATKPQHLFPATMAQARRWEY